MITFEERFWSKVEPTGFCWLWLGYVAKDGYAKFAVSRDKNTYAHRVAYELLVGPITTGMQLDHLCRVRHCVNPDHLEPVSCSENHRRGRCRGGKLYTAPSHCPRGHEYTELNSYSRRGSRECRDCGREKAEEKRSRSW